MKRNINIIGIILLLTMVSCAQQKAADQKFTNLIDEPGRENIVPDTSQIEILARMHVIKGSNYQQQKRYAEAILEFLEAKKYDSSEAIYFALAKNYKELEKYDPALNYALKAINQSPEFIPGIELLADIYIMRHELDNAVTCYNKIIGIEPEIRYKLNLARIYEFKDKDSAIAIYEGIIDESEDYISLSRLVRLYEEKKDYEKQTKALEKLYRLRPGIQNALILIDNYTNDKNYESLFEFLSLVDRTLGSEDISACYGRTANYFFAEPDIEGPAVPEFLSRIDNRFFFDYRLMLMCGYLSERTSDTNKAIEYFDRTLRINDTIPDIPLQVGLFYSRIGSINNSISILKKAEIKYPDDYRFPFYIGAIYSENNNDKESIIYLVKASEIEPDNIEIWTQLGIVYDKTRDYDNSDNSYEKALELKPDDPLVNNNYAYTLAVRGMNLEKALAMSEKTLKLAPDNGAYLDTYAWVQYKKGNYTIALEYLLLAIEKGSSSGEIWEHLGDVYIKLNNIEKAKEAYNISLETEPGRSSVQSKIKEIK